MVMQRMEERHSYHLGVPLIAREVPIRRALLMQGEFERRFRWRRPRE
jgi:hypothetical protein